MSDKRRPAHAGYTSAPTIGVPSRSARTLERQIEEIMSQVAPRRQTEAAARKVASVLFVTISDFVALCEGIEPPEVGLVLDVYLRTVADSIGKFLGTLQNTMGDTVMASWNAGYPQPDHALLAVNSAIDMVERLDDVNQRLRMGGLPEISYSVGVNTGDTLVRLTGRRDNEVIGDAVNVAHLLSVLAPEGTILVAEGTCVSTGDQIVVEETDITMLPGKQKPVRVFRVIDRLGGE